LTYGEIPCTQENAHRFIEHFSERWHGAKPFAAAHIYYDAIVLLAFGMQYAAAKNGGTIPAAKQLHQIIRDLNKPENSSARWDDIPTALEQLASGKQLRFIGAAAEYEFNNFGLAEHVVFDMWTIHDQSFVAKGSYYAKCFVMY
jgi:neutral amino acid transport system substrate-binding protein